MHTTKFATVTIHHNGGYEGDCLISEHGSDAQVRVPFEDLRALVADYMRQTLSESLDAADDMQVLAFGSRPPSALERTVEELRQRITELEEDWRYKFDRSDCEDTP
jgi:hypothetical protein